jgi:hypothetical protein
MATGGSAGGTSDRDDLPARHPIPDPHRKGRIMRVAGSKAATMIKHHPVAVRAVPAGLHDDPIAGSPDLLPTTRPNILSAVHRAYTGDRPHQSRAESVPQLT